MKRFLLSLFFFTHFSAFAELPDAIQKIMDQPKYKHAIWGLYVKDLNKGTILYELHSDLLFSPASTTKLFSTAALLNAYGDDYRFKTPIVATGVIEDGELKGDLVLIAQGDLTFGGRQLDENTIAYTKLDHINANSVPGTVLTKEDPLYGLNELAKQVHEKGIKKISGDVIIDDSLFQTVDLPNRGLMLSPIMVNENLIDIELNPTTIGDAVTLFWRPEVPGYNVISQVRTVGNGQPTDINITSDEAGQKIVVTGTLAQGEKNVVRTFSIKDPKAFARAGLIQALEKEGIEMNISKSTTYPDSYKNLPPVAMWVSPPLSEYVKLILKVSHNLGADLVPMLLAAQKEKKTFEDGMLMIGDFLTKEVKLSPDEFVLSDAAGGNENRLTPQAEIKMLEYMSKLNPEKFKKYYDALPILGVDGSLEEFAKKSNGAGHVKAKTGTGVSANLATGKLFLITQALAGYIDGKNGHRYAFMLAVNNGKMPELNEVFAIFEDESQISSLIYDKTN